MKLTWEYLAAAAGLVVTLLLAWFIGVWVHLQGANLLILRLGIVVLGVLCILGFLMWARGQKLPAAPGAPAMPAAPTAPGAPAIVAAIASDVSPDDVDRLVHEAEKKVATSRLGKGAKLSGLPAIFVLGDPGSGKTSAVLNCGLDPELLSGQIYQEGNVVPTAAVNLWFARKSVFVEAAGKIAGDPKPWTRLLHRLSPSRFQSIFGKNHQAPRAAIVTLNCEKLVKPAGPDALISAARMLRARLEEMAHQLGASFPVYVIFTKLDQVAYAAEFLASLRDEETSYVLGITLPVSATSGVYAEQETKRLSGAFNSLFSSLADCRPGLLGRERDKTKQPGVYEFPRQFRRLGKPAVEFLVELCRPSHLRSGPFLRGFYFSGQRMIASAAPSPAMLAQTAIRPAQDFSANATTIMRAEDMPTMAQMAQAAAGTGTQFGTGTMIQSPTETRLVPQWVFLSHVFSHVILQDRAALGASGASTKVNFWRRLLFATATGACALLFLAFLISFFSNHSLESQVVTAAQAVHAGTAPATQFGSLQDWQALDALRQPLQELSNYQQNGAPLHMRWGLYSGGDLYAQGRAVYFARFRQLLFDQTYNSLHSALTSLPITPGPNDDYSAAYNPLKAYLIVSSHPEKSTREFLTPALLKYWLGGRDLDDERKQLVQQQLDFYADELKMSNPYSLDPDLSAIGKTHNYLAQFAATQRIYRSMLAAASKQNPSFNFNRKYPDAVSVVRDSLEVPGAFTKPGWNFMKDAVQHADQYTQGEEWVLGDQAQNQAGAANSAADLTALYTKDYVQTWRDFLNQASVSRGVSYQDQAQKLSSLSGNRSPLLMLLCEVSQNTAVDSPDVAKAFAPSAIVVASPCQDQVIQSGSQDYVAALTAVQTCLQGIPPTATGDALTAALATCNPLWGQARAAADKIAQKFPIDQDGKMDVRVKALLEAPTGAATLVAAGGGGSGKEKEDMCNALKGMGAKYPFNASATTDVALPDFVGFFQPGGGLFSKFLDAEKAVYVLQGAQYTQKGGKPDPAMLALVNRGADIQRALFAGGAAPQFKFTVKAHPQPEITNETITIEGVALKVAGNQQGEKAFVWSGSGAPSSLSINGTSFGEFDGPWAAFHLLDSYTWTGDSSGYHLTWPVKGFGGQQAKINGKPLVAEFDLDSGNVPLFQRGYLAGLKCPAH